MSDVEAQAHARAEILDLRDCGLRVREEVRDVRAVVVDGVVHLVLVAQRAKLLAQRARFVAHLLAVDLAHLERHADHGLDADPRGVVERLLREVRLGGVHVYRSHAVAGDAMVGALPLESVDFRLRRLDRQVEVLDTEVMNVQRLDQIQSPVGIELVERVAGDAELERHLAERVEVGRATLGRRGHQVGILHGLATCGEQRERTRAEERTTIHHWNVLLLW